jgi:hypothetical protein
MHPKKVMKKMRHWTDVGTRRPSLAPTFSFFIFFYIELPTTVAAAFIIILHHQQMLFEFFHAH